MTKDELLEQIPGDMKPWAEIWLPILLTWTEDKILDFIADSLGLSWWDAYDRIVDSMTVDQKLTDLQLRKEAFAKLNNDNSAFIASQRSLLLTIIAKAFLGLKT